MCRRGSRPSSSAGRCALCDRDLSEVVTDIIESSPVKLSGLRQRDVITQINTKSVDDADMFYKSINDFKRGQVVRLRIMRGGKIAYIAFER